MGNNFKKCPYCELNYIRAEDVCCEVCYSEKPEAREAVRLKNREDRRNRRIQIENESKKAEELYLQKENAARKSMLEMMKPKGFIGFLRTENFDNFIKIYKSGFLRSRNSVLEENIDFTDNADPEIIAETSDFIKRHVRFYFRCKTPTNYGAYYHFGQTNPVMMVFDSNLIYDEEAIFCDGNAKANMTIKTKSAEVALEKFNWKEIFDFGPFNADDFIAKNRRNAEFLLPDKVSIEHVKCILFKFKKDMDKAIELLGNDKRFQYDPYIFF